MNTFKLRLLTLALTLSIFGGIGCSHHKVKFDDTAAVASTEKSGDGLTGKVEWAKNKGNRMDLHVVLTNHYPFPITLDVNSWSLVANTAPASLISQGFSGTLGAGVAVSALLRFQFASNLKNPVDAVLTLEKIGPDQNSDAGSKVKKQIVPLAIGFSIQ